MLEKVFKIFLLVSFICIFSISTVFAEPTELYGYLSDPQGDSEDIDTDIGGVSWGIDEESNVLYIDIYRQSRSKEWNMTVDFISYTGEKRQVVIECSNNKQITRIINVDTNELISEEEHRWVRKTQVSFEINLTDIASDIESGYEFDFFITSGSDRAPDSGVIKISTIPTMPKIFNIVLLVIPVIGVCKYKEYRRLNNKGAEI